MQGLNGRIWISHWQSIEKYRTRVRALGVGRSVMRIDGLPLDLELVDTPCGRPWPFLLLRIEKLFWLDSSYEYSHLLSKLLSPTLTELHVYAMDNLFMYSVLPNLGVTCPLMKSFSTTGFDPATSVPVSTAVVCEAVDGPALLHLSTLPSLEHLQLSFLSLNRGSFKYSPTTFSNPLHHLTIHAQGSEPCVPFLEATWISARSVHISLGNIPRSSSNETFLLLLASRVTAQQVQALSLDSTSDWLLTITEIMPLFSFCTLQELTLPSTSGNLTINNQDLIRAAKSWPKYAWAMRACG
ncbi:uncharacterized protein BJ212DRAFT_1358528 [Suillus subaureus]|uniref:Uncharacterized protein n=1 Tax=Suillus subaureus TaxID=48587 RepID=A0A9P7EA29_9AGAM|nr:uncharacterized protein BJ212DRAFT_1358528 [Suillus subaureus]KAG1815762.1 hypothetical protein BJ212DRAFT_1358528 [Suillus subaureus]